MAGKAAAHEHDHPGGVSRWLFSTNHKDIGTMYLIFAIICGIIGGIFSILMRMELQSPGLQFFGPVFGDHTSEYSND